eukprot:237272-Amphidinium_carterae.1
MPPRPKQTLWELLSPSSVLTALTRCTQRSVSVTLCSLVIPLRCVFDEMCCGADLPKTTCFHSQPKTERGSNPELCCNWSLHLDLKQILWRSC